MMEADIKFIELHVLNDFLQYLIHRPSASPRGKPTLSRGWKGSEEAAGARGLGKRKAVSTSPRQGTAAAETEINGLRLTFSSGSK